VLDSRDRNQAAPTFPPDGLYLTAVEYDPVWGLPVRAHRLPSEMLPDAGLESTVSAPW
jgi:tRNA pseudouridine38-40 synthase